VERRKIRMRCPNCEKVIRFDWLSENFIVGGDEFECPYSCNVVLRLIEDEGTYLGAKQTSFEIVDD
jgi:hypothetical protein